LERAGVTVVDTPIEIPTLLSRAQVDLALSPSAA
jgi:hypothetical protein